MRSALARLFALAAPLVASDAKAAQVVLCNWEGRTPVAITVEGDVADLRYYPHYGGASYYDVQVTRSGVWLLLDKPRPVLGIQLIEPDAPIEVAFVSHFDGGRCWRYPLALGWGMAHGPRYRKRTVSLSVPA